MSHSSPRPMTRTICRTPPERQGIAQSYRVPSTRHTTTASARAGVMVSSTTTKTPKTPEVPGATLRSPLRRRPGLRPRRLLRWRWPEPLTLVMLVILVAFVVYGIGSPLWGQSVFAGTDYLSHFWVYRDGGFAGAEIGSRYFGDTIDSAIPNAALFGEALR